MKTDSARPGARSAEGRLSVIIPALNEERNLPQCLAALRALDAVDEPLDILVIDNGSTDRTVDIARSFGARVFICPPLRLGALRNFGVKHSSGDLLAFVDADCIVAPDWLASVHQSLRATGADLVGGFYLHPASAGWLSDAAGAIAGEKHRSAAYVPAGNMIVKRECFEAVGGFDESLETNEDVDLCLRVRRAGYGLSADPSIRVLHLGVPTTIGRMFRREIKQGRTSFRLFYQDIRHVANLRVVLFSAYFALLGASFIVGGLVAATTGRWSWLAPPLIGLAAVTAWLCSRFMRRKGWLGLVAYNLLYGCARGYSLISAVIDLTRSSDAAPSRSTDFKHADH